MDKKLRKLLEEVKKYIELTEVTIDSEWGACRDLKELQEQGAMPKLYARLNTALANAIGEARAVSASPPQDQTL